MLKQGQYTSFLTSAVGLNAVAFNTYRIIGPALAGISIATVVISHTLLILFLLYAPLLIVILTITLQPQDISQKDQTIFLERLQEGLHFALNDKRIVFVLGVVAINSFFVRGIIEIQPAIIGQVFNGSSDNLAIATSAAGVGALIAAIVHSSGKIKLELLITVLLPATFCGIMVSMSIAFMDTLLAVVLIFAVIGFVVTFVGVGTQTVVQLTVKDGFRARVLTWWSTLSFGGLSLGGIVVGTLGEWIKIQHAVGIVSSLGLIAALFWWRKKCL